VVTELHSGNDADQFGSFDHFFFRRAPSIYFGERSQGVANSVGFALAERILNAKFGDDLCKHWTYVFMGDGCLMEGISEEAISMAGHYKLGHLIAFWDNNSITIDGPTRLAVSDLEIERFRASGWHVQEIDGHDTDAIRDAITAARAVTDKPSMITCKTIIGFGFPTKAGTEKAHSDAPGEEEIAGARKILGWDSPPFVIPETVAARVARDRHQGPQGPRGMGRPCQGGSRRALFRIRASQRW
jgi:transketolase